jgi:hypothetical protein
MKILDKKEVHNAYNSKELQALWKLIENNIESDLSISEKTEFIKVLKQSSYIHHNESNFLSSYKKIFSNKEKPLFSDKEEMIIQAIYTNAGAAEIVGLQTRENNYLLLQVHEGGIFYQVNNQQKLSEKELILDAIEMIKKLNEAFLNPASFYAEMLYGKFNQEIPEKDENEAHTIGNSKKNKL